MILNCRPSGPIDWAITITLVILFAPIAAIVWPFCWAIGIQE